MGGSHHWPYRKSHQSGISSEEICFLISISALNPGDDITVLNRNDTVVMKLNPGSLLSLEMYLVYLLEDLV